jgi:hypothetical protein
MASLEKVLLLNRGFDYAKTLMPRPNVQYVVGQGVRLFNLFKQQPS